QTPRGPACRFVLQRNQRGVVYSAPQKIFHHRAHAHGRAAEQIIEQVNEMYRVREGHAAVVARAFESAEVAPQNVHTAELSRLNCRAQPIRSSIEAEDVPNLQYA